MSNQDRKQLISDFFESLSAFFRLIGLKKMALSEQFGLNRSQFELLMILSHSSSLTVGEIAERMVMTSSAATQLVDGLVELQLVERVADQADRRRTHITISTEGNDKLKASKAIFLEQIEERLQSLSDDEILSMTQHFQQILHSLHSENL